MENTGKKALLGAALVTATVAGGATTAKADSINTTDKTKDTSHTTSTTNTMKTTSSSCPSEAMTTSTSESTSHSSSKQTTSQENSSSKQSTMTSSGTKSTTSKSTSVTTSSSASTSQKYASSEKQTTSEQTKNSTSSSLNTSSSQYQAGDTQNVQVEDKQPAKPTQSELASMSDAELGKVVEQTEAYQDAEFSRTVAKEIQSRAERSGDIGEIFLDKWGEAARKVAGENGLYASVMLAQAMLESGYGQSSLAQECNNLFGIKGGNGYQGPVHYYQTQEFINGKWVTVSAPFRHYDDLESSFRDNANILRNGTSWDHNYYQGTWKENTNSYIDACYYLQGRYATDPSYAQKLISIINKYDLTRFDSWDGSSSNTDNGNQTTVVEDFYYIVQKGDTLSAIASQCQTTVDRIVADNNISNPNFIKVGQQLLISYDSHEQEEVGNETETPSTSQTIHIVQKGETLTSIANHYGTTVNQIVSDNGISNPNVLYVGQELIIGDQQGNQDAGNTGNTGNTSSENQTTPTQTIHTIQRGETLSAIAKKYGTTVNAIVSENNISNPNVIYIGQQVKIPSEHSSNSSSNSSSNTTQTYTVQRGDTLSSIAKRYGTTVSAIASQNGINNPNMIHVGQKLVIK